VRVLYSVGVKAFVVHPDQTGSWNSRSGYRILVIENGGLRFHFPNDWCAGLDSKFVRIVDREPPNDRCSLMVSCRHISTPMACFPIRELLREITTDGAAERPILDRGPVISVFRPPLEAAWRQMRFVDALQRQDACTRVCLARGGRTLATLVFDFWAKDELCFHDMWTTLLETLAVGEYIADPSTGRRRELRG
jgi:hypothetical protein